MPTLILAIFLFGFILLVSMILIGHQLQKIFKELQKNRLATDRLRIVEHQRFEMLVALMETKFGLTRRTVPPRPVPSPPTALPSKSPDDDLPP